jgi:predicted nucleic acid-binding protein
MARIVVADASPLIGLSIVCGLEWLSNLFGEIWMPQEVRREVLSGKNSRGESEIRSTIEEGWLKVWPEPVALEETIDLDEGESACIQIALNHSDDVLLIMDERAGRAFAQEKEIPIAGTAAIIGMAKMNGLITSAYEVFAALHASDFRISATVIKTILDRVGE